jgi:S1-C subfamily serine protease
MATGGMLLEEMTAEDRAKAGAPATGMALRAKHVGEYGAHAAAKNAGFRAGDVIVSWDGRMDLDSETAVLAYGVTARKPGDKIPVKVLRGGKTLELMLPMQE